MKRAIFILLFLIPSLAYGQGSLTPDIMQQFSDNLGVPLFSGFVCTTISGTTTNLATYPTQIAANTLTNPNPNPVQLDSAGRASIFLGTGTYRIVLLNPVGIGSSSCNGTPTGSALKTVDGVAGFGSLLSTNNFWTGSNTFTGGLFVTSGASTTALFTSINNREYCTVGTDFPSKFANAAALISNSGGIVDCSNLNTPQTLGSDVFSSVTTAITVIWPTATVTASASFTIPTTMAVEFLEGGIVSVVSANTATFNGQIGGTLSTHFAGSGAFVVNNQAILPQWFSGANAGAQIAAAVAAVSSGGGVVDARNYTGSQIISSTVSPTNPMTLLLGSTTYTCSAATCFSISNAFNANGAGRDVTVFVNNNSTQTVFSVASAAAFQAWNLSIKSTAGTQTGGAAIKLTGAGGSNSNLRSYIGNIQCLFQYICLDSAQAAYWKFIENDVNGFEFRGVRLNNPYSGDEGDNVISNNLFNPTSSGNQATGQDIECISGCSGRVTANKFQGLDLYNYHMNWNPGTGIGAGGLNSTNLIYANNSHEPMVAGGTSVYLEATTGGFINFAFTGNEFRSNANNQNAITFAKGTYQAFSDVVITGNNFYIPNVDNGVSFLGNNNGDQSEIASNNFYGGAGAATGVSITSGGTSAYTAIAVGQNNWQGLSPRVNIAAGSLTSPGYIVPDNILAGIGASSGNPPVTTVTNPVEIPRGTYYSAVNTTSGAESKIIGQDTSDIVQVAQSNQVTHLNGATTAEAGFTSTTYATTANCASAAAPAVCGAAVAGSSLIAAGQTTVQVNTTAVNANSIILVTYDQTLGTKLGVTCNTAQGTSNLIVSIRTVGSGFDIQTADQHVAAVNPICMNWFILNFVCIAPFWTLRRFRKR